MNKEQEKAIKEYDFEINEIERKLSKEGLKEDEIKDLKLSLAWARRGLFDAEFNGIY